MSKQTRVMSACGVLCSECAAYIGRQRGAAYRRRAAAAWRRIYGTRARPEQITCGGCLGPDAELFHTSLGCRARRCCRARGLRSCGECAREACPDLERAQRVWDGVPAIAATLSPRDRAQYAAPYCGHRERIAAVRDRA